MFPPAAQEESSTNKTSSNTTCRLSEVQAQLDSQAVVGVLFLSRTSYSSKYVDLPRDTSGAKGTARYGMRTFFPPQAEKKVGLPVLLRLHRSFKAGIGLDEASYPEAGGSRPEFTSVLSAQRGSNPGNKITAQKLLST